MGAPKDIRHLAREAEVELIERAEPGGLHITVIGDAVVHWWPESKRQTMYVEGSSQGRRFAAARDVIIAATAPQKGKR